MTLAWRPCRSQSSCHPLCWGLLRLCLSIWLNFKQVLQCSSIMSNSSPTHILSKVSNIVILFIINLTFHLLAKGELAILELGILFSSSFGVLGRFSFSGVMLLHMITIIFNICQNVSQTFDEVSALLAATGQSCSGACSARSPSLCRLPWHRIYIKKVNKWLASSYRESRGRMSGFGGDINSSCFGFLILNKLR